MNAIRWLFLALICLSHSPVVSQPSDKDVSLARTKRTFKDRMLEFIYRIMNRVVPHSDQKRANVPESSLNDYKFHVDSENYLEENLFHYMYQTYADPVLESFVYEPGKRLRRTVRSFRRKAPKKIKKYVRKEKLKSKVPDKKGPPPVVDEQERLDQFREHATSKLQEWIAYHQSILDKFPNKEPPHYTEWMQMHRNKVPPERFLLIQLSKRNSRTEQVLHEEWDDYKRALFWRAQFVVLRLLSLLGVILLFRLLFLVMHR